MRRGPGSIRRRELEHERMKHANIVGILSGMKPDQHGGLERSTICSIFVSRLF